jgi:hypothetical protein
VADSLQVKFAMALLEQVLKTFAEQVHNHDVEHAAVIKLFVTNKVKERNESLSSHLVNQF